MAAAPSFFEFLLNNINQADTVYPMVFDSLGTNVLWDGSKDPGNEVPPGEYFLSA